MKVVVKVLIFTFFSVILFGQTGVVEGIVKVEHQPIDGTKLTLVPSDKQFVTDYDGTFEFVDMPAGEYILTISRVGLKSKTLTFTLSGNEKKELEINLELDVKLFDEIEIVSQETGLTERTPYNIRKLNAKNVSFKGNPSGIMGVLQEEPGVNAAEMGHGISKPFIRGLGFSRIVTIYQGNKLENHQWGADHGLGLNDLGIASVDVIKGPASILYGSGALGGVIILNDDQPYLNNNNVSGNIGTTLNTISSGVRTNGSIGKQFENGFYVATDIAYESHADYFDGDNRLIGNSRFNSQTIRFHSGINKETFKNKFSYSYNNQYLGIIEDDEMEEGESLATNRSDRKMQLPFQQVVDHVVSYQQSFKINNSLNSELNLSHHFNERDEIEDAFDEIDLGLLQNHTFYNFKMTYKQQKLTHSFGLQGSHINMRNKIEAEEILIPNATYFENGMYYLGTYTNNNHTLQGAARFDYRTILADANQENIIEEGYVLPGNPASRQMNRAISGFTGSFGYSYKLKTNHLFKVNFSSGFRAPDLAELFSNGPHPGTNRFEIGNADYKQEQSFQGDVSWLYRSGRIRFEVNAFANFIDNYIFFVDSGDTTASGLNIWEFQQTNALLFGGEFRAIYSLLADERLTAGISGNITRGQDIETDNNLTFIPADRITFSLNYQPWREKTFNLFTKFNTIFTQNRPGLNEETTKGYNLLNLGAKYTFNWGSQELDIALTAYNLLNETYVDHIAILRAFNVTHPGRNLMINIQWRF